jgi:hypothetical protein
VPRWTFGRPTENQLRSLLTPAGSKARPVAPVPIAVTTIKEIDTRVSATRMDATTTHTDSVRPTSMVQAPNTLWTPPRR